MIKYIVAVALFAFSVLTQASGGVALDEINVDATDKGSLKNGARIYMDNCMSCHSLKYARYNRVARDLEISEEEFVAEFMYTGAKFGELMENSIPEKQAKAWFGATPPDLTLVAKLRNPDWLYSYLRGFYADDSRPWGVNNVVFKDVGMPHILMGLQGLCAVEPVIGHHGEEPLCAEYAVEGQLSAEEYDSAVFDLVNFLAYMADPSKLERERLGWMVFLFLGVFLIVSYLYTRELKKDIH